MVELHAAVRCILRHTALTGCLALAGTVIAGPAAAHRHHHPHRARVALAHSSGRMRPLHARAGGGYVPPFSAMAVDGNSGRVLYAQDENAIRHPASITKVMTLYLLFERLERHELSLDDRITVSSHAAAQSPTKLGLRPGATIRIEDAVKSIVTKSANDMAVALAERMGGDEHTFAQMMTRKAHALGMSRSNFVNASGLPDDMQLTTAHDLVLLGRAIHDHFPRYFHFFSTPSFRYAGQFMPNHNHLMEQVEGMDGIKTGYTRSSGFNLLSSVSRNGHWLVSVVLGGRTRLGRDHIMANLIASDIDKCATVRTAPMIAENPALEHVAEAIPVVAHEGEAAPPVEGIDDDAAEGKAAPTRAAEDDEGAPGAEEAAATTGAEAAVAVVPVRPEPVRPAPAKPAVTRLASLGTATPAGRARPAYVPGLPKTADRDMTATGSIRTRDSHTDGSTLRYTGAATATPSALHQPRRERAGGGAPKPIRVASLDPKSGLTGAPAASGRGWMVQVGATPTAEKATDLLARARAGSRGALNGARPFTERVQKGRVTLFRARFAGLDAGSAEAACRALKRGGVSCFATRD